MWVLAQYLPLMIGHMVSCDDSNWLNFLLLLEISRYLFAPRIDDDDIAVLDILITEHHRQFQVLYPGVPIIPKMHFLIHSSRLIRS